jgi:predicted nucleic acid-binding protein
VTTEYILTEVANHLSARRIGRATFGVFLADLRADPKTEIVDSPPDLSQRGVDLYLNRADKQWSLTDCVSFLVMKERKITDSLTADRHFEQAGFSALLV